MKSIYLIQLFLVLVLTACELAETPIPDSPNKSQFAPKADKLIFDIKSPEFFSQIEGHYSDGQGCSLIVSKQNVYYYEEHEVVRAESYACNTGAFLTFEDFANPLKDFEIDMNIRGEASSVQSELLGLVLSDEYGDATYSFLLSYPYNIDVETKYGSFSAIFQNQYFQYLSRIIIEKKGKEINLYEYPDGGSKKLISSKTFYAEKDVNRLSFFFYGYSIVEIESMKIYSL